MKNLFKNLTALCLSLFLCFGLFGNFKVFGKADEGYEVLAVMENTYQGAGELLFVKKFNDANVYNALMDNKTKAVPSLNIAKFFDKYFKIYVDPKYIDDKVDVSQSTAMNTKEIFGVDDLYAQDTIISEERVKGEYDAATGSSTFYIYIPNVNMHNVTWDDTNGIITVSEKKFVVVESDWSGGVYSGGGEIEFRVL